MKNRSLRVLAGFVLGICLCTSALATTTVAQADIAARKALELKQYSEVVNAYSGFDAQSLNDQSYYRLAIAQQKLGNALDAQKALDSALVLNPKGTFASSPERLALLKADIAKIAPAPINIDAEKTDPLQASAPGKTSETVAAAAPVSSESILQAQHARDKATDFVSAADKKALSLETQLKVKQATITWISIINLVLGVILIGVVIFAWRRLNSEREKNAHLRQRAEQAVRDTRPPSDVDHLVKLRDAIATMRKLTTAPESEKSSLLNALEKLEPLVVMEIGRNHFRSTGKPGDLTPEDQVVLKSIKQLEAAPMALQGAEPDAILQFVFGSRERFAQSTGLGV